MTEALMRFQCSVAVVENGFVITYDTDTSDYDAPAKTLVAKDASEAENIWKQVFEDGIQRSEKKRGAKHRVDCDPDLAALLDSVEG